MPTPRKNQKAADPESTGSPDEAKVAADATEPDAVDAADDAAEAEPVALNRAERRSKGKGTGQVQPSGRGKAVRGTGPAQGPRLWANRRSG